MLKGGLSRREVFIGLTVLASLYGVGPVGAAEPPSFDFHFASDEQIREFRECASLTRSGSRTRCHGYAVPTVIQGAVTPASDGCEEEELQSWSPSYDGELDPSEVCRSCIEARDRCLVQTVYRRSPRIDLLDQLREAAEAHPVVKTLWHERLIEPRGGRAPIEGIGELRDLFRETCEQLHAFGNKGQGFTPAAIHYSHLCVDDAFRDGGFDPYRSSGWRALEQRFYDCVSYLPSFYDVNTSNTGGTLDDESPLGREMSRACFAALKGELQATVRDMRGLGEPGAAPHAVAKVPSAEYRASIGGYTDFTLEDEGERRDPLIARCRYRAIPNRQRESEARGAAECLFAAPVFPEIESLAEPVREALLHFMGILPGGRRAAYPVNSSVQNFLLQIRALAIKTVAGSLAREMAFTNPGARVEVPASCEGGTDRGYFKAVIQSVPVPPPDPKRSSKIVAAGRLAQFYTAEIGVLNTRCHVPGTTTGEFWLPVGMPTRCPDSAYRRARLYQRASNTVLAKNPALAHGSDGFDRLPVLSEGGNVMPSLRTPAVDQILSAPDPEAKAGELIGLQAAQMREYLGKLCDPRQIPTREILKNNVLLDTLLDQPGVRGSRLDTFAQCVKKELPREPENPGLLGVIGETAVCVVGGPFACQFAEFLNRDVSRYIDTLRDAEAALTAFENGIGDSDHLMHAMVRVGESRDEMVVSGALLAADAILLGKEISAAYRNALRAARRGTVAAGEAGLAGEAVTDSAFRRRALPASRLGSSRAEARSALRARLEEALGEAVVRRELGCLY